MSKKKYTSTILSTLKTYQKIRDTRVKMGLTLRKVAGLLDIDVALLSKMERGERNLSREILVKLARIYKINTDDLLVSYLSDKIIYEIRNESFAKEVLRVAEAKLNNVYLPEKENYDETLASLLKEINTLKKGLSKFRPLDKTQVRKLEEYYGINYTYDSNKIEGNTLTLQETALVVEKGMTIGGKSLREHLEAINHYEAIAYIKELVSGREGLSEWILKNIHQVILKGVDDKNAGKYREIEVRISGSRHIPPEFFKLPGLMEKYFEYYDLNRKNTHPVIFAADMHQKLVDIHPFIDGNGRTARLVMNLILMQSGFPIVNISGEMKSRLEYYKSLENVAEQKDIFRIFIAREVKKSIEDYLNLVGAGMGK